MAFDEQNLPDNARDLGLRNYWGYTTHSFFSPHPGYCIDPLSGDQLDVIIKNGMLIICENKSSTGKSQMYTFERKVQFYEKKHNRKADRMIVISPMIDRCTVNVAEKLGIEIYGDSEELLPAG